MALVHRRESLVGLVHQWLCNVLSIGRFEGFVDEEYQMFRLSSCGEVRVFSSACLSIKSENAKKFLTTTPQGLTLLKCLTIL